MFLALHNYGVYHKMDKKHLVSRLHGAVISSGTELERLIKNRVKLIEDLDSFLQREIMQEGVVVADLR